MAPGHTAISRFADTGLDSLTDFFPDEPGRPPCHDDDDDGEGKNILVCTGKGKQHGADRLQAGKEEAAQDSAIDAAKTADDGGGKTDDPEIETDAEIDLVVIEPVHNARDGGERRANGECHQDDSGEIDAHGPGGFFV